MVRTTSGLRRVGYATQNWAVGWGRPSTRQGLNRLPQNFRVVHNSPSRSVGPAGPETTATVMGQLGCNKVGGRAGIKRRLGSIIQVRGHWQGIRQ